MFAVHKIMVQNMDELAVDSSNLVADKRQRSIEEVRFMVEKKSCRCNCAS